MKNYHRIVYNIAKAGKSYLAAGNEAKKTRQGNHEVRLRKYTAQLSTSKILLVWKFLFVDFEPNSDDDEGRNIFRWTQRG